MTSTLTKVALLRAAATRGYSQLAPVSGIPSYHVTSSVLSNNLVAVTADNSSSINRVSIVFRAGSRDENQDTLGAAHLIRVAAGLSCKNATQFAITRNIQQVGANLTATSDRETIAYTLEGTPSALEKALPFLIEVATQQVFHPWELAELSNRLKLELAIRPLQLRAIDLLHKAAFRSGLGNSLFIPKFQIGKVSSETLQHFAANNFSANRASVVGIGLCDSDVQKIGQSLKLGSAQCQSPASPYKGGEIRSDKGGDFAFVAIAGEGAPITKTKEALTCGVLQKVLSAGSQLKWSTGDNGVLNKALGGSNDQFTSIGINANYSDSGLVGVLLAVPSGSAGKLVEGAVKVLKSDNITDADLRRGKNQLKTSILFDYESGSKAAYNLGRQAVLTGNVVSGDQLVAAVDAVTLDDVKQALQKAGRNLTLASVGNLRNVPYAADLK